MKQAENFGVFKDLPFETYQRLPGLNQSTIKQLLKENFNQRKTYFNLRALQFGNAGHCLLLEPEKFDHLYVCAPKNLSQRKKTGKEKWKEFCEMHSEKIVLQYSDWSRLQNIRKCFQIHPQIKKLFSNGNSEVSLFWYDSEYGFNCKARLDWFDNESHKILDLKFTNNISKATKFEPIKINYAIQANWYNRGIYKLTNMVSDFFYIFIEKFSPHFIQVVEVSNEGLIIGKKEIDSLINKIHLSKR